MPTRVSCWCRRNRRKKKKQFIIDTICQILGEINKPPVAKNDFSVILQNQNIEKLVTQNDFLHQT